MTKTPIEKLRELKMLYTVNEIDKPYCPQWLCAQVEEIADEIEAQYMRLPVDKNGVPVRPNDTLYYGEREIRGSSVYGVDSECVYIWNFENDARTIAVYASDFTHTKPDTVESIIANLLADAGCEHHEDGSCEMGLTSEQITEYAERIKKAVEHG